MRLKRFFEHLTKPFVATAILTAHSVASDTNHTASTSGFWFRGKELFPIDDQIAILRAADIDGDGLVDLVIANNSKSKINILFNMTGKTNPASLQTMHRLKLNELPPDARFKIESIASEKRIAAMVVKDLNSDGKPDIAYYGDPKELIVCYNRGTNSWTTKRFKITDGLLNPNALEAGDINGDGLTDLVLLGEQTIYVLYQKKDGTFSEPERIPFTTSTKAINLADLNKDSRLDLLLIDWDSETPVRVRYQNPDGTLGQEIFFKIPQIRAFIVDTFGTNNEPLLVTIMANSGRAAVWQVTTNTAEHLTANLFEGQFSTFPLSQTKESRGTCWTDFNKDGLLDLIVAEPESGEITIYLQNTLGELTYYKRFPSLAGVTAIESADWNKDENHELFLLSPAERLIGVTSPDPNGRLPFPTFLPIEGKPLAMTTGILSSNAPPRVIVMSEKDDIRRITILTPEGPTKTVKLSETYKANPLSILAHDADQDGLNDIVIFTPYEKIKILRQLKNGEFEEIDVDPPGGATGTIWGVSLDVDADDKPELILPQKNFLRAVVLQEKPSPTSTNITWTFKIKDQINGIAGTSNLRAITSIPTTNSTPVLCALDLGQKCLTFYERDPQSAWQPVKSIELPVLNFTRVFTLTMGTDHSTALCFVGDNCVGFMKLAGKVINLTETDTYETPIKNARLLDVIAGDLNHDGLKDLVFLETEEKHVDIVEVTPAYKLVPGTRWKVFEDATVRSRSYLGSREPREALVIDVTGDKKDDLLLLVHDRVILYPAD